MNQHTLLETLKTLFADKLSSSKLENGEITITVPAQHLIEVATVLRDNDDFSFEMLMDLCGVDYLEFGVDEWSTDLATATGFSRGREVGHVTEVSVRKESEEFERFAVVYHLLSIKHNQRIRIRVFAEGEPPCVPSVITIWNSANWFEREAFDLFGILFKGHPDLRRILTDYGFVGHPFRKDFPLSGNVEMRYDAKLGRVVYEKNSIEPRVLVPKVIRSDNRYIIEQQQENN